MISALLIVFREVLEASLVISIVLSATRGLPMVYRWIGAGLLGGLVGAVAVALFAGIISNALTGFGEEIFNASVLVLAVLMLAWHNIWMSTHGRQMVDELKSVGATVQSGAQPLYVLSIVVGLAVLREGSEAVLFLYGLGSAEGGLLHAVGGGVAGLLLGAGVGAAIYFGLVQFSTRHLFAVTGWMINLLAAGMAAKAMTYLGAAGLVSLGDSLWDSSFLLSEHSLVGKFLHILVGYMERPTALQLIVYLGTLTLIGLATHWGSRQYNNKTSQ